MFQQSAVLLVLLGMKNFLLYLERAWLVAMVAALGTGIYNIVTSLTFNHLVYFPLICAGFCYLIYRNISSQRKFVEKHKKE